MRCSDRVQARRVCRGELVPDGPPARQAWEIASARPGPLQDFYQAMLSRGMREELARVTLTRKVAAIVLRLWKTGDRYDPAQLTVPMR